MIVEANLDEDQFRILALMTPEPHKLVLGIAFPLSQPEHDALERMMHKDWIRFIDISPMPFDQTGRLYRVFRVMPEAVRWYVATKMAMN